MDHSRNTHMMLNSVFYSNDVPFQPLTPPFVSNEASDMGFESFDHLLSKSHDLHTIDVDQRLPDMFSGLKISPEMNAGQPELRRRFSGGEIGSSVSVNEGFAQPLTRNHIVVYNNSDLGVNSFLNCFYGFDFDFDRKSYLESKKLKFVDEYTPHYGGGCCSSNFENENEIKNKNVDFMRVWSLKELRGMMCKMAKDQNGCRILQTMLERSTLEEVEIVLCELKYFIADLMKDQFGNYLVQKLVSMCNDGQKLRVVLSLIQVPTDIITVCMNPHGTRAVQKLLENLNPSQVKLMMNALCRGAATLAVDPNGHHVIQYCLINFDSDTNKPILTEIARQCYNIATDRSGCCVLQACVEHSCGELRTRILTEIMANSVHLAEDPFGNYVLQHIVGLNIPELTALLVRQLKGNFAALSCNKYASNVVEKCLNESCEEDISTKIIMELVRSPNASMLLVDPYANFVVQCALKVSKGLAHDCLCGLISKNITSMRTNLYGKKILERFEKKGVNVA